jgi:hypothetical protein
VKGSIFLLACLLVSCGACKKDEPKSDSPAPSASSSAALAESGPPCRNDPSKKVGPNGKVTACVLAKPYVVDGYTCEWGKAFELYPNGKLRTCYLREAKTIDGTSCHDHVSFYASGKLERCRVYATRNNVIEGVDVQTGDWVTFYESGAVKRLELVIAPMKIQGVSCKGHQNYFHENGKLKKCELADADGGPAVVCFDDQGKRQADCSMFANE